MFFFKFRACACKRASELVLFCFVLSLRRDLTFWRGHASYISHDTILPPPPGSEREPPYACVPFEGPPHTDEHVRKHLSRTTKDHLVPPPPGTKPTNQPTNQPTLFPTHTKTPRHQHEEQTNKHKYIHCSRNAYEPCREHPSRSSAWPVSLTSAPRPYSIRAMIRMREGFSQDDDK